MSVTVIGLNHHTAPLEVLERMTIDSSRLVKALHDLFGRDHVSEAVVLSTCNRVEVYVVAERFHGAYADVRNCLSELAHVAPEDFAGHLYSHYDDGAAAHLFGVAAGLDSAVVGESEILGQVRAAWERARAEGTCGPLLNGLFRHALETGKRARTDTGIARHTASVPQAAVEMATARLGTLDGARVLVLGAGEMGEGMIGALARHPGTDIRVANRTMTTAEGVASRLGATPVPLSDLPSQLLEIDVLLTSTGATSILVEHGDLETAMRDRAGRALLIVDVAVPRDVDPGAADIDGVTLLDMNDLRDFAQAGRDERSREVVTVRSIVTDEVERYLAALTQRQAAPTITALYQRGEQVRQAEVERLARGLDDDARAVVDAVTRGLVAKLLHEPAVRLKASSGSVKGERLSEAVRELFELD